MPALALKIGFDKGSPEEKVQKKWLTERYHAPSDDVAQPVDKQAAGRVNYAALASPGPAGSISGQQDSTGDTRG